MNHLYYKSGSLYAQLSEEKREYFYEDRTLKTVESYRNGKLESAELFWPNGKLKRRCFFKQGIRHGTDEMWSEQGVLLDSGRYEEGKAVGTHRRWAENGQLIEEISYLDSSRFDLRRFDEFGVLRVEALWDGDTYREKSWDRFQECWVEKRGHWDGKKLIYL